MELQIRKATIEDLDVLHEFHIGLIEYESNIDPLINKTEEFYEKAKKDYEEALKKEDHMFLIAEKNGKPVGYVYGWIEKPPVCFTPKLRGYLCDAFVKEKFRGKNIGEKLTEEILKIFKSRNVSWVKLGVYAKNINAINVWKKLGFEDYIIEMTKMI